MATFIVNLNCAAQKPFSAEMEFLFQFRNELQIPFLPEREKA